MTEDTLDVAAVMEAVAGATSPGQLALALLRPAERRLVQHCALPLRFTRELIDDVLRGPAGVDSETVPFERLTALSLVLPQSGRPGWFTLDLAAREQAEREWLDRPTT